MNRYLKITLICFLSFATFLALGSGAMTYFYKDDIIRFVIESINRQVTSSIDVQSVHFSVVRKFPNATVEFRQVTISPAEGFDTLCFEPAHSRHLLSAENVFLEISPFRMLTGDYRITQIEVHNGNINLLTDQKNRHNFIFWKTSENASGDSSPIELQNVTFRNSNVYYAHRQSNTVISLHAERSQLSGRFSANQYSISADWEGSVQLFSVDDDVYIRDKPLEFSGKLDANHNKFHIRQSDFTLAMVKMSVSGGFTVDSDVVLDLLAEGKQIDYSSLVTILPEPFPEKLQEYPGKGHLDFTASIKGKAGSGIIPKVEAKFGMTQGVISHRQSKVKLTGLSFTGTFTTGDKSRRATSMLQINDFACNIGGGNIKGSLIMQNLSKPQITARISNLSDLGQLHDFFHSENITSASGRMRCELTANIGLKHLQFGKTDDIERLEINGTVKFEDASVHFPEWRMNDVNGSLQVGNRITTNNLSLTLNNNDLKIDGYMERWSPYLLQRSKTVYIKADVKSQQINLDALLMKEATSEKTLPVAANHTQSVSGEKIAPLLPENIEFETRLEALKFRYGKFEADNMKANLVYQPRILEVRSAGFSSMSGKLTGNCLIANDNVNHIHVRGETTIERFDVRHLFHSFDNFGQNVLRAEHVTGRLSGDLGFAIDWDNRMQLQQDKLIVEGLVNLDGGELLHFEPMNNLSKFVALEELQNIRFSNLQMRISVRDGKISFPQTNIQSSALDMMGSGEHYFDNSYSYHVKILLSEILAAKARRVKRENLENEFIEDGGKRTALYLKVAGKGDNFTISYDRQAARASIAEDIRNEKQNLKSILKEELGLFKRDSLIKPSTPENTGRLRFTFDDD